MWQPEPAWQPLRGGRGSLTEGLWVVGEGTDRLVAKRVRAPGRDEPDSFLDPTHPGYWRRELELATADLTAPTEETGLGRPAVHSCEEDATGYTLVSAFVEGETPPGPAAAVALGRLAATAPPDSPWLSRRLLRRRLELAEHRGGWPTLARTTVADLADELWRRRGSLLDRYDALPACPSHGDAVPGNLVATDSGVTALDWSSYGLAPAGADLGYFALSSREDFEVLLDAFLAGTGQASRPAFERDDVRFASRVMAVYTVMSQAEWALARAARGAGALAAKYRHPAVAPYVRAMQRQFPQIEALLG